ncbi:MAG: hypothetical protein IRY85_20450 [Micromonosporaceae bacterium]|nr:hypothetical protein [Micromonosporaceae bacterium]
MAAPEPAPVAPESTSAPTPTAEAVVEEPAAAAPASQAPAEVAPSEPAAPPAGTGLRRPPVEAEPIDLLAVTGAKGMMRKAAPVLVIVGLALAGLIVWLVAF